MKGYYFHNMDIRSTRAHVCQILNTAASISPELSLSVVLPKYSETVDFAAVKINHDLGQMPSVVFLRNFGIRESGIMAFTLFNIPAIFFLLRKKINRDIDFLYFRTSYFLPVAFVARILHVPFFYETHRRPISWSERVRDNIMSNMAAGIIVISSYMKEHYVRYGKKILVSHDAVSLERFASRAYMDDHKTELAKAELRKKLGFEPTEKIAMYAGTISKLKGVEYVLAAARLMPKISFVLVGSLSKEFFGEVFPLNVRCVPKVEQKDLPGIMQAADVLLLPHPKGEYSQSPMKLFEYMASGVPIVSSRLPSISEVLNDSNSVLVEPENASALAQGIEKAIGDTHMSQVLAEKALNDVQNFTWNKRGAAISEFIKPIISQKIPQ